MRRRSRRSEGAAVAKFAGTNVHQRLVTEPSYKEKNFEEAMKRAFLGTDEDLLAGVCSREITDKI